MTENSTINQAMNLKPSQAYSYIIWLLIVTLTTHIIMGCSYDSSPKTAQDIAKKTILKDTEGLFRTGSSTNLATYQSIVEATMPLQTITSKYIAMSLTHSQEISRRLNLHMPLRDTFKVRQWEPEPPLKYRIRSCFMNNMIMVKVCCEPIILLILTSAGSKNAS